MSARKKSRPTSPGGDSSPAPVTPSPDRTWVWLSLLAIFLVVAVVRIRLLDLPLERDEGEYAYGGQLWLAGVSPYQGAYNVALKLPGTCMAYAGIMAVFGQTASAIHAGLLLINLATAWLLFLLARRICGYGGAVVAAGTYALLSITPPTLGLAAHGTHFVMLPAVAGIFLLQKLDAATSLRRICCAGLLLGLAVLMKQTGAAFGLFAAAWLCWSEYASSAKVWSRLAKRLAVLALSGVLPVALVGIMIWQRGDWARFWQWTIVYAHAHTGILSAVDGAKILGHVLSAQFGAATGLMLLAGLGLVGVWVEPAVRAWRVFIFSWVVGSFVAVCPGWYFREHYFLQMFPVLGLLAGVTFAAWARRAGRATVPAVAFALAAIWLLGQWSGIFFQLPLAQVGHAIYGTNPFPEAVEIARYLETHSAPDARVAVLGSEPQIYFYSHRRAATGHICTYPLMERQPFARTMQAEMIAEIEKAAPEFLIYVQVQGSWGARPDSEPLIFDWFRRYQKESFELVAMAQIFSPTQTEFFWEKPANGFPRPPVHWVGIYERRKPAATNVVAPMNQPAS